MTNKTKKENGFTLIELLIYVALIVLVITIFTAFIIDVIRSSTRVIAVKEVNQNNRLIISSISQAVKTASSTSVSTHSIDILDKDYNNTQYYFDNAQKAVFFKDTAGVDTRISNEAVKVNNLSFSEDSNIISIGLDLETLRPSSGPEKVYGLQATSTVVSRRKLY